jgi:hypothetical protein
MRLFKKIHLCFFVVNLVLWTSPTFGKNISSKKIMVFPRASSIEKEIASFLLSTNKNDWRKVDQTLGGNAKYENKSRKYKIESGHEEPDTGDLTRYRFFLTKADGKKEPLATDPITEVEVIKNGQFLLLEPLILVNTRTWEKVDLAAGANISPYFSVVRYSANSNKILIAQFDCAYDCPKTDKTTIWEIDF